MKNQSNASRREGDVLNRMEIRLDTAPDALSMVSLDSIRRLRIRRVPALEQGSYRVRAVLSKAEHDVRESYWLGRHEEEREIDAPLVQYRVRGVSSQGASSKWVYSNLMTDEGEDILFQLLSDLADTLDWMDDPSIEYMMNKFLEELYKNDWLDRGATPERQYEMQERVEQAVSEIVTLFGDHTRAFREIVRAEPEELALLFKAYGVQDVNGNQIKDELFQVFYAYLEDQVDWANGDTAPEAYGEGENPFAVLSEVFELKALMEVARESWNMFPEDHVHFRFRDLVNLTRDPVVNEKFAVGRAEKTLNTFLFSLSVLWALPEDRLSMDLANLVEDIVEMQVDEHQMIIERDGATDALLAEVMRLVFEQTGQENDLDVDLTAYWLMRMTEEGLRIHVDTDRHERVTSRIDERVRHKEDERTLFDELIETDVSEQVSLERDGNVWNLERSVVGFLERVLRESGASPTRRERKAAGAREYSQLLAWPRKRTAEQVQAKIGDSVQLGFARRLVAVEEPTIGLIEQTLNRWGLKLLPTENVGIGTEEGRELLYSSSIGSTDRNRTIDRKQETEYAFNGHERFRQEEKEQQQYSFDEIDERYGLGYIQVGSTTI